MAHTPADPPAAALQIAVLAGGGPNHGGQTWATDGFSAITSFMVFILLSRSHAVSCRWQNPTQG